MLSNAVVDAAVSQLSVIMNIELQEYESEPLCTFLIPLRTSSVTRPALADPLDWWCNNSVTAFHVLKNSHAMSYVLWQHQYHANTYFPRVATL